MLEKKYVSGGLVVPITSKLNMMCEIVFEKNLQHILAEIPLLSCADPNSLRVSRRPLVWPVRGSE